LVRDEFTRSLVLRQNVFDGHLSFLFNIGFRVLLGNIDWMDYTLKRIKWCSTILCFNFFEVIMIDRTKIKKCPICFNTNIEHKLGDLMSKLTGITHDVPQTI